MIYKWVIFYSYVKLPEGCWTLGSDILLPRRAAMRSIVLVAALVQAQSELGRQNFSTDLQEVVVQVITKFQKISNPIEVQQLTILTNFWPMPNIYSLTWSWFQHWQRWPRPLWALGWQEAWQRSAQRPKDFTFWNFGMFSPVGGWRCSMLDTEIDSFETPAVLPRHHTQASHAQSRESILDSRVSKVALRAHSEAQQEQSRGTSGVAWATCVAGMVAMRLTSSVVNSAQLRVRT